jgi:hypothetical protein
MAKLIYEISIVTWLVFEFWVFYRERGKVDKSKDKNIRIIFVLAFVVASIIGNFFANIPYLTMIGSTEVE